MRPKSATRSDATSNGGSRGGGLLSPWFKEKSRRIVAHGLYRTGLLRAAERLAETHELYRVAGSRLPRLRPSVGPKFGILCYHRVGTEGVPLFSRLEPKVFEAQMRYVKKYYRVVPLRQLCCELQDARPVEPTLAITFDDGYRDVYSYAFPVLQKYQIPATIYLIGRCMETGEVPWYDRIFVGLRLTADSVFEADLDTPRRFQLSSGAARAAAAWEIICYLRTLPDRIRREWCVAFERRFRISERELADRMLTWEQVRTMQRSGVHFGAHTMTHPCVSRLDTTGLQDELLRSRQLLENALQTTVVDFAYPFGKLDDCGLVAEQFLALSGYSSAVTTMEGMNFPGTNLLRLRRVQIGDDSSVAMFAFRVSLKFLEAAERLTIPPGLELGRPAPHAQTSRSVT